MFISYHILGPHGMGKPSNCVVEMWIHHAILDLDLATKPHTLLTSVTYTLHGSHCAAYLAIPITRP